MTARGIRNNNPGNIRHGSGWHGLVEGHDQSFCTFRDPVWGIRALCRLLCNYRIRYELDTVYGIIDRYAPDIENDTNGYAMYVAGRLGVEVNEPINVLDRDVMRPLILAIIQHENGCQPYDDYEIDDGMLLAGIV